MEYYQKHVFPYQYKKFEIIIVNVVMYIGSMTVMTDLTDFFDRSFKIIVQMRRCIADKNNIFSDIAFTL